MEISDLATQAVRPSAAAAAPVLSSVVPNTGPAAGSSTVTLNGSSFTGATAVNFGANPALSYSVDTSAKITAVTPPGTGTVSVTVQSPGGTSNSVTYAYLVAPVLTAVSPSQGPTSGGTAVILTGTGLTGATAVSFGSSAASSFTVNSATQITAVAPSGTGAVSVSVTTPGGTSNTVGYTYVAAPALTAVSPSQGPTSGGTAVILTGTGLTGATAVSFGSSAASSFTVNSATQITAVAPSGTGAVSVSVTTPGGTSNTVVYTYVAAPALTAVSPSPGPDVGWHCCHLTGTGLTGATAVSFGANPASASRSTPPLRSLLSPPSEQGRCPSLSRRRAGRATAWSTRTWPRRPSPPFPPSRARRRAVPLSF